jgi:glycosyltransferase involved in cell wall biosynthesis
MGGAERSVLALSRWLYEHRLEHHFVLYRDLHGDLANCAAHPIEVVELRPEPSARKKISALRRYFAGQKSSLKPLASGYQSALHATLAGQRGFHTLMHDTPSLFGVRKLSLKDKVRISISNRIVAHGLNSGGQTIVTSEYLRDDTRKVFGTEAEIARMGGMVEATMQRLRPVSEELRLLSVSRVEQNKRIDWMLRALASLEHGASPLSARVNWKLDIVGKGSKIEPLIATAHELGIGERVSFRGFVGDAELAQIYDEAHLFVMPAVQGYGIPAIEALSRGIPVLLHRESGVSDILLETPWATVMHGGENEMEPAMRRAIHSVIEGEHLAAPPPRIPTEDEWAERVATLCGWL